ncbi:acyl-CoA thioester hydrolase [Salinibacillus kushneri]|uniref:Acyl-CoA thioester hydrolase n=1 Tax=Salinibacillus kushneri TaxID=237682 RepID=A0A1H9Z4Q7_9BACI|nr:thioesterase family protein [Salinibacillus kushneri]SES76411.1 acyl-CoA thioester hydrolase [Salinibacillus kushneri]
MTDRWYREYMRVQYKDTDQMGIVHHGNYVNWFEIGRTEWMRHFGISYKKMESMGLLLPVLNLDIQYQKSARFDDCIAIYTKIDQFSPVRLTFAYEARKISNENLESDNNHTLIMNPGEIEKPEGELLAKGTTTHMWVNQEWKPIRIHKAAPEVYERLAKNRT